MEVELDQELLKDALAVAKKAAHAGGEILRERWNQRHQVTYKGRRDLVTEADRLSEARVIGLLREAFPQIPIVSEEAGVVGGDAPYCWHVDPLDGTTNFAHGLRLFNVSIALAAGDRVLVGVVYDPMGEEEFTAVRGQGAWLNGQMIHVSDTRSLEQSLLVTGFPYDIGESAENNLDHFANFSRRVQGVRRLGSAALDLCYVACGRFDGYWEMKLHSWDMAAGLLLVEEAGGRISRWDGSPMRLDRGELVASNGILHPAMLEVLAIGGRPRRPQEAEPED